MEQSPGAPVPRVMDDVGGLGLRLLESITDCFCALDANWRFVFVNNAAREVLAPRLGNTGLLLGQNVWELFPGTVGTITEREYRRAVAEGVPVDFEMCYEEWGRWYSIRAYPVRGGGLAIYFRDITAQKMAARALEVSEDRHEFLVRLDDAVRPLSDPEEIVSRAARLLGEHLEVDRCAYANIAADEDTMQITGDYTRGVPSIVGQYTFTQFGQEVLRLMRANEPFVVADIDTHQPAPADFSTYRATQIRAGICVPLHKSGKFAAAMAVHQKAPRIWTEPEVTLVRDVANRCWEALERTRVTRVLQQSEERFRTLADNIAQLAWMADPEGWLFWYNQRWFDYTGTTFEQMQGWGWMNVHHPDYVGPVTEKWQRHVRSGEVWEDTFPLRGADGQYRWFLTRAVPIRDAAGKVERWFGTNTDVTEQLAAAESLNQARKTAEQAARAVEEAAERFRLFSEVVGIQMWTARPDGVLDYANEEVARSLSVDLELDILGNPWTNFVHPDDLAMTEQRWTVSREEGSHFEVETRLRVNSGIYRWHLIRAEALRDADGRVIRWFGSNTDIHDLKTAQRTAEAASQAKDDFLAALSHELRTPLAPVLMAVSALREEEGVAEEVRTQMGMVQRNIELEARLIDDLLDITRITRGKMELRQQHCAIHSLLGLAIEIVRDELHAKGICLAVELTAAPSHTACDPARIQQAFWNLLKNAVKFTPAGGQIKVHTFDLDGRVAIEVSDTGIGIAPESLEKIFRPFEQGEAHRSHHFGGLGLGLAITKAIVEMHQGSITARSAGPNQGATFRIELPSAAPDAEGAPCGSPDLAEAPPEPASLPSAKSLRLLVVEDHETTLKVMARLLRRAGHEVTTAGTFTAALEAAAGSHFDAVISDIGLPDGTGIQLMERLRAEHGLLGIALSGYGMEEDMRRTREAGFVAHLVKPVDFAELTSALAQIKA